MYCKLSLPTGLFWTNLWNSKKRRIKQINWLHIFIIHFLLSKQPCIPNPCSSNSICTTSSIELTKFVCNCLPGYTGTYCETQINYCSSNPCNNGTCITRNLGFDCKQGLSSHDFFAILIENSNSLVKVVILDSLVPYVRLKQMNVDSHPVKMVVPAFSPIPTCTCACARLILVDLNA